MRLIRFLPAADPTTGRASPRPCIGIDCGDGTAMPLVGPSILDAIEPMDDPVPVGRILCPLPRPPAIIGIGLNYRKHAEEQGKSPPARPMIFMKNPASVCGPDDPIIIPAVCRDRPQVDYECELAVIIGPRPCRNASLADALSFVLGYTAANDVSARWWQKEGGEGQFVRGKSFDTFCPLGPVVVTSDELDDPCAGAGLRISTRLDGTTLQDSTTADMIFPVAQLIAFCSQDTTLLPGTVILTGTPQGVGFARKPPVWLRHGSTVEVTVECIGTLRNPVTEAPPPPT